MYENTHGEKIKTNTSFQDKSDYFDETWASCGYRGRNEIKF